MIRTVKFPCQSHAKYIVAKSHGFLTDFSRVRQVSRFLTECKIFPQGNTKIVQYLWKYQYFLLFGVEKRHFYGSLWKISCHQLHFLCVYFTKSRAFQPIQRGQISKIFWPVDPHHGGASLNSKPKYLKIFKSSNLAAMQIWKLLTPKHEALVVQENPWSECEK